MGIHYSRKEYREIKQFNTDLTWEGYKQFKVWESKNYNPKADEAFSALLKSVGITTFGFDWCHKPNDPKNDNGTGHIRLHAHVNDRLLWLCTYCGYLCEVQDNKYIYHLLISDTPHSDLKYDIDSRGQVIIRPSQHLNKSI